MSKYSLIFVLSTYCLVVKALPEKPNIVLLIADDLGKLTTQKCCDQIVQFQRISQGYNDIGYHNDQVISPMLDSLARDGVILEKSYVQPTCTPSRSALMTGMYPFHIGTQVRFFVSSVLKT